MDAIMATPNPNKAKASTARENPLDRLARVLSDSADLSDDEEEEEEPESEPTPASVPASQAHH
jgi:hypothetical protein